jgi:hypothetical protein
LLVSLPPDVVIALLLPEATGGMAAVYKRTVRELKIERA